MDENRFNSFKGSFEREADKKWKKYHERKHEADFWNKVNPAINRSVDPPDYNPGSNYGTSPDISITAQTSSDALASAQKIKDDLLEWLNDPNNFEEIILATQHDDSDGLPPDFWHPKINELNPTDPYSEYVLREGYFYYCQINSTSILAAKFLQLADACQLCARK